MDTGGIGKYEEENMENKKLLIIGEKETFIVRVLKKKVDDAGYTCDFVPWTVDDINAKWDNDALITVYMDDGGVPKDSVLHFLTDKMSEACNHMVVIGEKNDIRYITDRVPGDLIYDTFTRPLNNEAFLESIEALFIKRASGDYKKSILIVDDDPTYLGLVREWLRDVYKVSMANSGLQAIKWLGNNKADLILLDYEMPITDGPQVLQMLRADSDTASIPVIFLTGKGDKESVMKVVALKPEGYFLKTIQKDELLNNLREFFLRHRQ